MPHTLTITDVADVTHNVKRLRIEKPAGYTFEPGQATEVAIDKDGWREEWRPFTFTALNDQPYLEFVIKIYPSHDGVTEQIGMLQKGDRLILDEPWGTIRYKGKGCFIAGGAGVTPFIAIIRDLQAKGELAGNTLVFSNKQERDIILREEFEAANGLNCIFTVTDEPSSDLLSDRIDKSFLQAQVGNFNQNFYLCGPPPMIEDVSEALKQLGANVDSITFEE